MFKTNDIVVKNLKEYVSFIENLDKRIDPIVKNNPASFSHRPHFKRH